MKYLLTILFFLSLIKVNAQDTFETTLILQINQRWYAKVIQKRYDKAIASNRYFQCDKKYCFEVDEEDLELRFGIFNRRVVPKRITKKVEVFEIFPCITEDGQTIFVE